MSTLKNIKLTNIVGGISCLSLLSLAFFAITPPAIDSVNADARATVRANVTPVMSIALDNPSIDINLAPSTSGAYNAGSAKLTVNTNNTSGYQLYMQTSSGEATLVSKNDQKIMPMVGSELTDNTWGYSLGSGFAAVPATETSIMNKATSGVDIYDLSFGVKVNSAIPAGTYINEVILSAVANPTTLTDMMDLFYMQDMTSTLCASTQGTDGKPVSASLHNEPSKQLIDIRDGKTYWISKLADQNCWMTQNLAYDITEDRIKRNAINPSNTDVSEVWNENSTYPPSVTLTGALNFAGNTQQSTLSWNLGNYVLKNPTDSTFCKIAKGETLANCNQTELYDGSQDTHYMIGNHYAWNAATAGTGELIDSNAAELTNASGSICPKGWRLPSSRSNTTVTNIDEDITFYDLLAQYGYTFPGEDERKILYGATIQNGYNLNLGPWYFTKSGQIDLNDGSLSIGTSGYLWTGAASENPSYAYLLNFNDSSAKPSYYWARWFGSSVRCVAR